MLVESPYSMKPVSYTHLRAHETDTSLFVGSVRCVIRDRSGAGVAGFTGGGAADFFLKKLNIEYACRVTLFYETCLLYTSPSPRDGHLSIRRQRQMCNKRQVRSRSSRFHGRRGSGFFLEKTEH